MKLTFLGTRGALVPPGNGHHRQAALLIERGGRRLLLDCGRDWGELPQRLEPDAILLSHAHDDHAGGIDATCPCPVWASEATWQALPEPLPPRRFTFTPGTPFSVAGFDILPCPVVHSFRAPAVAFRVDGGSSRLLYAPDVAALPKHATQLKGVDLYIADGTSFDDTQLRIEQGQLCGHAPLDEQLAWCIDAAVPHMMITHCGEALVGEGSPPLFEELRRRAGERGIRLDVAVDGLSLELR